MISEPIVLVLGAGASVPYGFPTGGDMYSLVVAGLRERNELHENLMSHYTAKDLREFRNALRESGHTSVDTFLEYRTDLIEIGRKVLATLLIRFEQPDRIFPDSPGDPKFDRHWYPYLYNKLLTDTWDTFAKNRLAIISYNYDRSLEYFLQKSLSHTFRVPDSMAGPQVTKSVEIVHLHGRLAPLSHMGEEKEPCRDYNNSRAPIEIENASKGIRIIHEPTESDQQFVQARSLLAQAKLVCFLGFGYARQNLNRLRLNECCANAIVIGSRSGLKAAEIEILAHDYPLIHFGDPKHDCFDFLRNSFVMNFAFEGKLDLAPQVFREGPLTVET